MHNRRSDARRCLRLQSCGPAPFALNRLRCSRSGAGLQCFLRCLRIHQLEEALGIDDSFHCLARLAAPEAKMTFLRPSNAIVAPVLWASLLGAADLSNYRGIQIGTTLEIAAKQSEAQLSGVTFVREQ